MRKTLLPILICILYILGAVSCSKDEIVSKDDGSVAEASIWEDATMPEFHLSFSEEEWNRVLSTYDSDNHTDEYFQADVKVVRDGKSSELPSSGFRLKGNTSRRRPEGSGGQKHNSSDPDWHHFHFALNFGKYNKGQKLEGQSKLHFKWSKDDPTYVREMYCYDLFQRAGIWTASRDSYARIFLKVGNEQEAYLGVYNMIETYDKRWVKARKKELERRREDAVLLRLTNLQYGSAGLDSLSLGSNGFLWKCRYGSSLTDANASMDIDGCNYSPVYELKTNTHNFEKAKAQLQDFILKVKGKSGESFNTWIAQCTDVELLLRTYAVNVAVGMWDDYWVSQNNWYIYFDTQDKYDYRFYFLPYDYDNTLGTSNNVDPGRQNPLEWGGSNNPLIYKILQNAAYREIYVNALKELNSSDFSMASSLSRIAGWHKMIKPYIDNDTGEDCKIEDKPASWGNYPSYHVYTADADNFFSIRNAVIDAL